MFTFEPIITLFLFILSLGMSFLLFIMLKMPGKNPLMGKIVLGLHLVCYFIALGWEVAYLFVRLPYISRFFLTSLYWAGPTLFFLSLWARGVEIKKRLILAYIIIYVIYTILLLLYKDIFISFYRGLLINDLIIILWILLNGAAGVIVLNKVDDGEVKVIRVIIIVLLLSTFSWGFLTTFDHSLSLFWGHAYILITLFLAQTFITINKRTEQNSTPDFKKLSKRYNLTKREVEIVSHLKQGAGNKDIAFSLGISEHTVKRHLNNLFKKCDVFSRFELTAVFMGWKQTDTKV